VLIVPSCSSGSSSSLGGMDAEAESAEAKTFDHGTTPVESIPADSGSEIAVEPDADETEADADTRPMLKLEWGGSAVFNDAQGNELGRANAPTKFPLPEGGSVTFGIGAETFTFLDVPAGATLRPYEEGPFSVLQQSIRINIVDRPGMKIVANTGCGSATGPGTHILVMDDACLEDGKGELFIYAWENGAGSYIEVKDIALGAAELEPLDVALPDWTDLPAGDNRVRLDTTGLPDGVTGAVGLYAMRGHRWVMNITTTVPASDAGSATAMVNALLPTTGTGWVRSVSYYPGSPGDLALGPRSYSTEPLAYPLASPATIDFGTLLPIPTDLAFTEDNGPAIHFNLPAGASAADVDRIAVTFAWGDPTDPLLWHIIAKPGTTRIALPQIPNYLADPGPKFIYVEVRAEDHPDVKGWVNVLKDWHDTYLFRSPDQWPTGRISRNVWQPTADLPD